MKKIAIFCTFILIFSLFNFSAVNVALADDIDFVAENSDASVIRGCHSLDGQAALLGTGQLTENVQAAFLYEANSDTVMYAWNADAQMYPASLVKVLTALIAVENGNMDAPVTVTQSAVDSVPYNAVSADLVAGEVMTLKDLLYCLLVDSANDAAAVIAEHISGSQTAFVSEMNVYAQQLGCSSTQFMNVHGLHDASQYTTARDAARIMKAAIENDVLKEIFATTNYTVAATNMSEARELTSGNSMMDKGSYLYYDARVIAGRTGVTEDGTRCFASVAESNGMRLISVVMGSESIYEEDGYTAISVGGYKETKTLLDAGFTGYKSVQILYADQALIQCKVADGTSDVVLGPNVSLSTVLPEDISKTDLDFRYTNNIFSAPLQAGDIISSVQIWYGGICVAEAELCAMNTVSHANASVDQPQQQNTQTDTAGWLVTVLLIVVGIGVIFAVIKFSGKIKAYFVTLRRKQYRRNRRRSK